MCEPSAPQPALRPSDPARARSCWLIPSGPGARSGSPRAHEQRTDDPCGNSRADESSEKSDIEISDRPVWYGREIVDGHEQEKHETAEQAGAGAEKCSRIPPEWGAVSAGSQTSVRKPGDQRRWRVPPRRRPRWSSRSPDDACRSAYNHELKPADGRAISPIASQSTRSLGAGSAPELAGILRAADRRSRRPARGPRSSSADGWTSSGTPGMPHWRRHTP